MTGIHLVNDSFQHSEEIAISILEIRAPIP
jgi:hypothetical protein